MMPGSEYHEALAAAFCDACEKMDVNEEDVISNIVLFFSEKRSAAGPRGEVDTTGDDNTGDGHDPVIKCIDASGEVSKIPQSKLYLPLKDVSKR